MRLHRSDLVRAIAADTGITQAVANKVLVSLLKVGRESIMNGDEINLAGIGTLVVKHTEERRGHNPATNQPITIPAGRKLSFKVAKELKAELNGK
jgi:DNA-binding protein HU-beta